MAMSGLPSPFRSADVMAATVALLGSAGPPTSPSAPVHAGATHAPSKQLKPPLQTTGFSPTHAPAWQVSVWVQASPLSHAKPSAWGGFEQTPVAGSQLPAVWH